MRNPFKQSHQCRSRSFRRRLTSRENSKRERRHQDRKIVRSSVDHPIQSVAKFLIEYFIALFTPDGCPLQGDKCAHGELASETQLDRAHTPGGTVRGQCRTSSSCGEQLVVMMHAVFSKPASPPPCAQRVSVSAIAIAFANGLRVWVSAIAIAFANGLPISAPQPHRLASPPHPCLGNLASTSPIESTACSGTYVPTISSCPRSSCYTFCTRVARRSCVRKVPTCSSSLPFRLFCFFLPSHRETSR